MISEERYQQVVLLLKQLISIPSFSREEEQTAAAITAFLSAQGVSCHRQDNNIWALNKYFDPNRPSILLNSHHDTVKPNPGYTRDPFQPTEEQGRLYGLGSNDAGGPLVSLVAAFLHFYEHRDLKYNLVLAATAEEEISGANGIESIFGQLPNIEFAIVGEPTQTNLAIAERGLMVLDCKATGRAGHAARNEGENAIYKAMKDIAWFSQYRFPKVSDLLGPVKMTVTSISTPNKAHNVVPDECNFIADIRIPEQYTHEEILQTIEANVQSVCRPRSMRIRSSSISAGHPLVQAGRRLGKSTYGSPTTSDAALIPVPVLKCGPGDSARSHTADEYIGLDEISAGIETYIGILEEVIVNK